MRLTKFTDYSLRVLIYLGQHSESRVTITQISEAYGISKNHLMKVVSKLTHMQLIAAQRGPGGGIRLNRPTAEIRLDEVVCNTEKHLDDLNRSNLSVSKTSSAHTRLESYLHHALQKYLEDLGRYTLADVLEPQADTFQLYNPKEKSA